MSSSLSIGLVTSSVSVFHWSKVEEKSNLETRGVLEIVFHDKETTNFFYTIDNLIPNLMCSIVDRNGGLSFLPVASQ